MFHQLEPFEGVNGLGPERHHFHYKRRPTPLLLSIIQSMAQKGSAQVTNVLATEISSHNGGYTFVLSNLELNSSDNRNTSNINHAKIPIIPDVALPKVDHNTSWLILGPWVRFLSKLKAEFGSISFSRVTL